MHFLFRQRAMTDYTMNSEEQIKHIQKIKVAYEKAMLEHRQKVRKIEEEREVIKKALLDEFEQTSELELIMYIPIVRAVQMVCQLTRCFVPLTSPNGTNPPGYGILKGLANFYPKHEVHIQSITLSWLSHLQGAFHLSF